MAVKTLSRFATALWHGGWGRRYEIPALFRTRLIIFVDLRVFTVRCVGQGRMGRAHLIANFRLPNAALSIAFTVWQTEEYYTHRWTVYVRGANNEDLSHVVQKVRNAPATHGC